MTVLATGGVQMVKCRRSRTPSNEIGHGTVTLLVSRPSLTELDFERPVNHSPVTGPIHRDYERLVRDRAREHNNFPFGNDRFRNLAEQVGHLFGVAGKAFKAVRVRLLGVPNSDLGFNVDGDLHIEPPQVRLAPCTIKKGCDSSRVGSGSVGAGTSSRPVNPEVAP